MQSAQDVVIFLWKGTEKNLKVLSDSSLLLIHPVRIKLKMVNKKEFIRGDFLVEDMQEAVESDIVEPGVN